MDYRRRLGPRVHFLLKLFPLIDQKIQICVQCLCTSPVCNGSNDNAKPFRQKTFCQSPQTTAFFKRHDLLGNSHIIGHRHQDQESSSKRDIRRDPTALIGNRLLTDFDQNRLILLEKSRGVYHRHVIRTAARIMRGVASAVLALLSKLSLVSAFLVSYVMMVAGRAAVSSASSVLRTARVSPLLFGRFGGIVPLELADDRTISTCVPHPVFYIFNQIGKMQECILLLPNIYKRRLDTRHDPSDPAKKNIPNGAFVLLIFDKKLRKITVLNDGDPGLLSFVNNNFFRHKRLSGRNGFSIMYRWRKE